MHGVRRLDAGESVQGDAQVIIGGGVVHWHTVDELHQANTFHGAVVDVTGRELLKALEGQGLHYRRCSIYQ
jgi:hypothetical protein